MAPAVAGRLHRNKPIPGARRVHLQRVRERRKACWRSSYEGCAAVWNCVGAAVFRGAGARHVRPSLATGHGRSQVNWGKFSVVTTGSRRVVTTLSAGAAGTFLALGSASGQASKPNSGGNSLHSMALRQGQGTSAGPTSDAHLQALQPPGFRRSDRFGRPPKRAGRCGDGHHAG